MLQTKAIIFDLDGVLVDSMPYHFQAWKKAFSLFDIAVTQEDIYFREGEDMRLTVKEVFQKYKGLPPSSEKLLRILQSREVFYRDVFTIRFFPEALELLVLLKNKGIRLGLTTGSVTLKTDFQNDKEFLSLFDVIISGKDTRMLKPDPEPYKLTTRRLKLLEPECCVIENSPSGIRSARAADLQCIAVRGNSPLSKHILIECGAEVVYEDIKELKKHFTNLINNSFSTATTNCKSV